MQYYIEEYYQFSEEGIKMGKQYKALTEEDMSFIVEV
jgi:hypothetical protein